MIKDILKSFLPVGAINVFHRWKDTYILYSEMKRQTRLYSLSQARAGSLTKAHIESRVMFRTHQIEKGLSHDHMRYGFGEQALEGLSYNLGLLRSVDSKYRENYYYKTALAALSEYVYRHRNGGYDLSRVRQLLTEDTWSDIQPRPVSGGGSLSILKTDKKKNESIPFENLFENRHSIREYSESTVADEEVMRAIRIAMKTPSVCNRQPVRIRVITNKGMIVDALKLQQGFNGYPAPPMLLLITADNKMLFSAEERNEGFVDGGLFAMSLLLSLESRQLAACPLNTMFPEERDKATRKLLGVEDTEFLVMYIAVGHFKDESKTCVSHRHAAEDIVSFLR